MKKDKKMKKNEKAPKTIPKIWLRNGEYQNSWNYPFHLFFSAPGIHHSALKKRNGTARSVVKKVSWKSPFYRIYRQRGHVSFPPGFPSGTGGPG